jgi:hypothetical protein
MSDDIEALLKAEQDKKRERDEAERQRQECIPKVRRVIAALNDFRQTRLKNWHLRNRCDASEEELTRIREELADSFITLAQRLRAEGEEYRLDGLSEHGPKSAIAENLYQLGRQGERDALLDRLQQLQKTPPEFQFEVWQIVGDLTAEILDTSEEMWGVPHFGKHAARARAGLVPDPTEVTQTEGSAQEGQTVTGENATQAGEAAIEVNDQSEPRKEGESCCDGTTAAKGSKQQEDEALAAQEAEEACSTTADQEAPARSLNAGNSRTYRTWDAGCSADAREVWNLDPREAFEQLRDSVCESLAIVSEVHQRALAAPPKESLPNLSLSGRLFQRLSAAVCVFQAIWFDTLISRYLDRREGPVYLDNLDQPSIGSVSGSCFHDLGMGVAVGLFTWMEASKTAKEYVDAMRFKTAAGDFVGERLAQLISHVRCECLQGIDRWERAERLSPGSARATNHDETQQEEMSGDDKNRAEKEPVTHSSVNPDGASAQRGGTAEALVRQYLAVHPNPQFDEAKQITGLTEQRIRRTQAWKDHEENLLDEYLRSHPDAETPDVEREFGFSPSKTVGMAAWSAHMERKEASKPPRKIKERPLRDATAKCRPDENAVDPHKPVEVRDELFRAILEKAVPDTRGHLNRLSQVERDGLLDHLLSTVEFDAFDGLDRDRILTTALEVTESWLENHEQEIRERNRKDRNQ